MRDWKPLSGKRLAEILRETEKDAPYGDYCAAEVYQIAREVQAQRQAIRKLSRRRTRGEKS